MSRYSIWIVSPPNYLHSHAFDEVAIGLHAAFRALGLDAEVVHDSSRLGDVTIVLGCNLLKGVAPPPPDRRLILFNLEQITPNSPWLTQDYLALLGRYPVWDYSQGNIAELAKMGIKAQHCGIGYAPELTCIAPAPEDIDVLFVGSVNERRLIVLKQLAAQGINVDARFNLYGADRDAFVARAKIILNVHFYDARLFEIVRVSYLLANRKCVVSETGSDTAFENQFGSGIAFAPYAALAETCVRLLQNPAERKAVAEAGFARFSAMPQAEYLQRALATAAA
jgi:hypothetical protein